MNSMAEIYEQLSAKDALILEKQAAELKVAEEEAAAGKIMARGFADEARKFAAALGAKPPGSTVPDTPNDLGAIRQFKLGPGGQGSGVNPAGQKVQSTPTGGMAPPKPPQAPKPTMK